MHLISPAFNCDNTKWGTSLETQLPQFFGGVRGAGNVDIFFLALNENFRLSEENHVFSVSLVVCRNSLSFVGCFYQSAASGGNTPEVQVPRQP